MESLRNIMGFANAFYVEPSTVAGASLFGGVEMLPSMFL